MRRSSLRECKINVVRQSVTVMVDASMGVVEWDGTENGPEMLARADRSMYLGKVSAKTLRAG